ncbi:MAG TPA: mechanosensitive ion channel domain-containing protein [Puia sp.]|nr:mechanosensitive ion channel domain-containing protein [Puia sp.]
MHDFWNLIVFGNPLRSYIIVASTILFVIILKRFISRLIGRLLFSMIQRVGSGLEKSSFLQLVVGPIGTFIVVFVSMSSIEKLHFPPQLEFDIYEVRSKTIFQSIGVIILVISFIWLLMRLVDFIAQMLRQRARADRGMRDLQMVGFLRDFLKAILGIIGLLIILDLAFKVDVSNILASLGLAGAAVALAAKESIENLIASFVIFFDKPFTAGDVLKVNNISGTVEKIGLRSTRIRTDQKTYVTVPNKQMVDSIVDNLTLRTQRKGELRLEVSLTTSAAQLDKLIEGLKDILKKDTIEKSTAFLNDITATAFLINVDYFTAPIAQDQFNDVKQEVNLDVLQLLETLKIDVAGASTTVTISGGAGGAPAGTDAVRPTGRS